MKLVSVVMPTRGRREWAKQAVECYLAQTYEARELVILDDEDDRSFPDPAWLNAHPSIRYITARRMTVPRKRNIVNMSTKGELICHFDSDDWQHPDRLAQQVRFLEESGKGMVGFYDLWMVRGGEAFLYKGPRFEPCGSSQLYTRELWMKFRFDENIKVGSDMTFARHAYRIREVATMDPGQLLVMRVHDGNTSKKQLRDRDHYKPVDWTALPELFRQWHDAPVVTSIA